MADSDSRLIANEISEEAKLLAKKMPPDVGGKTIYVRNLVTQALLGKLDLAVFKMFLRITNTYQEAETCLPRAKLTLEREKRR